MLGSQSPRRRALLEQLVGPDRIRVLPPRPAAEPEFGEVATLEEMDARLQLIARMKHDDVCSQLREAGETACVVTADTVIVGLESSGRPVALGKPPEANEYATTVRKWFGEYFAGRRHLAKTGVCVGPPGGPRLEQVVTTEVWFRADAVDYVEWYIQTGEPRGKAGGYAIQEAGSLFVERLEGSLTNVVGLPLAETLFLLNRAGAIAS